MNDELQPLERELAALMPAKVPSRLIERIAAGVAALPDPAHAKLLPFPLDARRSPAARSGYTGWWAAAAAIALLGSVAALLAPDRAAAPAVATGNLAPAPPAKFDKFVPAGLRTGVSEVADEGVMRANDHDAYRRVRVVYLEHVILVNERGERIVVEQPRVEYLLVPVNGQ